MNRRKYLQLAATGAGGILVLPSFLMSQGGIDHSAVSTTTGNILVFLQLNGGNDGLNTFIPFNDPLYISNRPKLAIRADDVINKVGGMGFHPSLKGFGKISQNGNLTVLQNVGYPNPNRSHFRGQEIWQTASDSQQFLHHGWLGRFLDLQCKDEILPSLNVDNVDSLALKADVANGLTFKDFHRLRNHSDSALNLRLSDNPQLDFVRKLQFASIEGLDELNKALQKSKNAEGSYRPDQLSRNLQSIARLIKGELSTKVFYTSLSGFDTHNNQLQVHQNKLRQLDEAVWAFYKDLQDSNLLNRVTLVIFSEFGRRVKENGSGTDHGTAGPMFIIGGGNRGKVIGDAPNLNLLDKGDLIHQIDFRSVYASLLKSKFDFDPKQINIANEAVNGIF